MRQDFIRRIRKEAVNMSSLINDILMISRLESNRAVLNYSNVDLASVAQETVEGLQPIMAQNQVYVHQDCDPVVLWADEKQMRELLGNLIGNAVKYNRQGGQVWITIKEDKEKKLAVIQVKDNGTGIPAESLPRIFERFYRTDASRNSAMGGSGIGLSIVKKIIEDHGGYIWATSKEGEGTCLHFVIRKYREAEENE